MKSLVGYTGFVGSNLLEHGNFDNKYNSKNIQDAYGTEPRLLIYAGVRAEKYLANQNKDEDFKQIKIAFGNIKRIKPKNLVLISTVDVYKIPKDVNEKSIIELENLHPYGYNRFLLEQMVREEFPNCLIVRLPSLFGTNLKKNFIYDVIHIIPTMLSEAKYKELSEISPVIAESYIKADNGFYQCKTLSAEGKEKLKSEFLSCGFSALNFTDSRAKFQFYNLSYLYDHIMLALDNNIKLLNIATEPICIQDIYEKIFHTNFVNELNASIPEYDYKTIYSSLFGGNNGYIFSKEQIIQEIITFVESHRRCRDIIV